jgi:type VI secretion system protein ImpG
MKDNLYAHYERELSFFRRQAKEFALRYPSMADALLHPEAESKDPHVERLIEAFALIAGRIHSRLDDEYPELTSGLLDVLYPHYLAPIPSMAIVEFDLDKAKGKLPDGLLIERGAQLRTAPVEPYSPHRSTPVHSLPCKYRTSYPVQLWPVEIHRASVRHAPFPKGLDVPAGTCSILQIELASFQGLSLAKVRLNSLRFFIARSLEVSLELYELILNHVISVAFVPIEGEVRDRPLIRKPDQCLAPVGFEVDEGLLPYSDRSFPGYCLLTELFAFPSKFLFFELSGLREAFQSAAERNLEVVLYLDVEAPTLERIVDGPSFRLGCTPAVNIFEQTAEPIRLDHSRREYLVLPDVTQPIGMEIYRVESVRGIDSTTGVVSAYEPLYGLGVEPGRPRCWVASRRGSSRPGDDGSDVYLSTGDRGLDPRGPSDSTLVVKTLCTNRNLPLSLIRSGKQPDFRLDAAAPLSQPPINCLVGPTVPHRPPMGRATHWQLISHLSLNYLSIVSGHDGVDALKQLLQLYRMFRPPDRDLHPGIRMSPMGGEIKAETIIQGITSVACQRDLAYLSGEQPGSFCRGLRVTLEFDAKVNSSEAFFLGGILERFFGLYASINSFSRLWIKFQGSEGYLKQWPPRAGTRVIL